MHYDERYRGSGVGKLFGGFVLGAVAGAATSFFLFGDGLEQIKNNKEARRRFEALKDQLLARMETTKDLSKDAYDDLVDETVDGYARVRNIGRGKMQRIADRLKAHYRLMRWEAQAARDDVESATEDE